MTELYNVLLALCFQALLPNVFTIQNLPAHQQMYIIKGATEACHRELRTERFLMCAENGFKYEECKDV